MRPTPAKSCSAWRHRAFTLVEVVASIVLLGTLLVGMLTAHRRHAEQIRGAKARLAAIEAMDKLLLQWQEQGTWGAATAGRFTDDPNLTWRWSVRAVSELRRAGVAVGRLEVFGPNSSGELSVASVEVLVPAGGTFSTAAR